MYVRTYPANDGLGFIGPLITAGVAVGGALFGRRKKDDKPPPISEGEAREWLRLQPPPISEGEAREWLRLQYLEIFGRDLDPGAENTIACMVRRECSQQYVRDGLFNSGEYADKKAKGLLPAQRAARGEITFTTGGVPTIASAPGAIPGAAGIPGSGFGGGFDASSLMQYAPYAIGGIVLLSLLRK